MDWLRFYFDFVEGIFCFFTLEFFAPLGNKDYNISCKKRLRVYYLIYTIIYAIPKEIPCGELLSLLADFVYLYLISNHTIKTSIFQFLKYKIYIFISTIIFYLLHSTFTNDFAYAGSSELYYRYKILICAALVYVFPCLFAYTKRLVALHGKKHYGISFCIGTIIVIFVLSYLSLAFISGQFAVSQALPVVFSFHFIIIAVCLNGYSHILLFLETNAKQKVLISKYELEAAYYQNMKDSLDSFHALRHDLKNHLIILNGYAAQNDHDKLRAYLGKISCNIIDLQIIRTPHDLTSSILNTKVLLCRQKHIEFDYKCKFTDIHISDFHLITILGNILDNAIAAAEKTENGSISFSMEQTDTYLSIVCRNNYQEKIVEKGGSFLSTKENPNPFHGLGIKNIQNSVTSLDGVLDIQYDNFLFTVSILLPNYA